MLLRGRERSLQKERSKFEKKSSKVLHLLDKLLGSILRKILVNLTYKLLRGRERSLQKEPNKFEKKPS
jgi:hypothetical protein